MSSIYWISTSSTDWSVGANWSGGSAPVSTDDVWLTNNSVNIDSGLAQSGVTLNSLQIDQSFTGKIGAAATYLVINATTMTIGRPPGDQTATGSSRIHINGTFTTVNVIDSASSATDAGLPPICLKGTMTLNVSGGKVGVAALTPVETATTTTVNVTQGSGGQSPIVTLGPGITATTLNIEAGKLVNKGSGTITTARVVGGQYQVDGNSAHTTLLVEKGTCNYNGTGTVTTLKVYDATMDFSNDPRSKTVTTTNVFKGAKINAMTGVVGSVAFTNGIVLNGCDLDAVTLRVGNDRTVSLS